MCYYVVYSCTVLSVRTTSWREPDPETEKFLDEYDRAADSTFFAERFLTADPSRAAVVDRAALDAALPARRAMFAEAGVGPLARVGAAQLDLDPLHVLLTVEWEALRLGSPLQLTSTFLLRRERDGLCILAYLNHRDIAEVLG
jgi:hypothetical protein